MLYTETVESGTLGLLRTLMRDNRLSDFLLAGGTNLALRLGHRYSVDLDLFSYQHFDIVAHIYPLIDEPFIAENVIRLYSIRDIVAMKLVAISDSGKRLKDFVDIAFLSTKMSLTQMLEAYSQKYQRSSSLHALRGLAYFDDINFDVPLNLINCIFSWEKIEKRIREMIKYENRIFETAPC